MSAKVETKEIKGNTYTVTQLSPSKALPLKFKVMGALGDSVIEIAQAYTASKDKEEAQLKAFAAGLEKLFAKSTPEELTQLLKHTVTTNVRRNDEILTASGFDQHFQDDLVEIYLVFLFVLQVNFGDFIKGLGSIV